MTSTTQDPSQDPYRQPDAGIHLVDQAILTRRSVRAFTDRAVAPQLIEDILAVAARAPSGTNTQPWRAYVLRGAARDTLADKVCKAHDEVFADPTAGAAYGEAYDYYPAKWFPPYIDRRRQNGYALYDLVGIPKGDKQRMHEQHQRNFRFFDAPVGLMFTLHRDLGRGSFVDYGMFLEAVMVAARARGLDTCPQAAWNRFASIILPHIGASDDEVLVCGMALGYADDDAAVNRLVTPREPTGGFVTWLE
jgi:nitroreductase